MPERLAIVVVNYRNGEDVERALRSALGTAGDLDLELVVVDNASGDGSPERLVTAVPSVKLVRHAANRGFAAGVNTGFRESTAPLVLVLNPDTIVEPGALQALVAALRADAGAGVVAPLLVHEDGSPQPNLYRHPPTLRTLFTELCIPVSYARHALGGHPHVMSPDDAARGEPIAHAYGAALLVRREAWEQAGPLDEGFFLYLEETEWQERVREAGWRIAVAPDARIVHFVRGGGAAAEVPSPHYLTSAYRYFGMRGVPAGRLDALLLTAIGLSRLAFTLIALIPGKREQSLRRRAGYARLTRWVRNRQAA